MASEEDGEGFGQFAADGAVEVVADVELLEEGLVELAAKLGAGAEVELMAVLAELESLGQGVVDVYECLGGGVQAVPGSVDLPGDAVLFFSEEVGGDLVGVVELEQLAALVVERGESCLLLLPVMLCVCAAGAEGILYAAAELLRLARPELDAAVVALDEGFDVVDRQGLLDTGCPLLVPSDAHEVLVGTSVAVVGPVEDEAATAVSAVDRSFEVVVVAALFLTGCMAFEDSLDLVPSLGADQRLMAAWVGDAPVGDGSFEVGVAEESVQLGDGEGLGRPVASWKAAQAAGSQFVK